MTDKVLGKALKLGRELLKLHACGAAEDGRRLAVCV